MSRWLYLLQCLRPINKQWDALKAFIVKSTSDKREKRILDAINDPSTRPSLQFLIHLFEISECFEKWFQQVCM